MTASRKLTWLHLSDLHFQEHQHWQQNVVLDALMRDVLSKLPGEDLQPDFVFVTGDIARTGRQGEYVQALQFFSEVARVTATCPEDAWFVVPGNHDVDRQRIKQLAKKAVSSVRDTSDVGDMLTDADTRRLFTSRQHDFFEFTASFLGGSRAWCDDAPWRVESRTVHDLPVAVVGLNSAWTAEGGDEDQGRLLLGEMQVRTALAEADAVRAVFKIALVHHPLEWLRSFDQERAKALLMGKGGVHFLLRGHLHKGRIARQDSPDAQCMELAAGALWQDATYPHGVTIVQVTPDAGCGQVHLFRYSPEARGFWKPDNFLYENVNDGTWLFDLPRSWGLAKKQATNGTPFKKERKVSSSPVTAHLRVEWDRSSYRVGTDLCRALVTIDIEEPPSTSLESKPHANRTRVHHVLVLDVSGSMDQPDKYPVLTDAVDVYVGSLADDDMITLIPFSSISEELLGAVPVAEFRDRRLSASALLSAWPHRFSDTIMAPALQRARDRIVQFEGGGFDGTERILCLTDGQIHDYIQCRPFAQWVRDLDASFSLFGFGQDFDAPGAESLADEAGGTVRYVRTVGSDLSEYFGHMARTSQRIVLRDAALSLHLEPGVTCFNVFTCRPQERHVGQFADTQSAVVVHRLGFLRYGTPYVVLFELRPWEVRETIGTIQLDAIAGETGFHLAQPLSPTLGTVSGSPIEFVEKMAVSVSALIRDDRKTQLDALEARIELYRREGRAPQHVASLERQLEVLRRGGSISELSADDLRFASADAASASVAMPLRHLLDQPTPRPDLAAGTTAPPEQPRDPDGEELQDGEERAAVQAPPEQPRDPDGEGRITGTSWWRRWF